MDRRTFLAGTGAVLLAAPLAAEAQQAGKVLESACSEASSATPCATPSAFRRGLRELGYVEGQNIVIEMSLHRRAELSDYPRSRPSSFASKVDVIVTRGSPSDAGGQAGHDARSRS